MNKFIPRPSIEDLEVQMHKDELRWLEIADMDMNPAIANKLSEVLVSCASLEDVSLVWSSASSSSHRGRGGRNGTAMGGSTHLEVITVLINALISMPKLRNVFLTLSDLDELVVTKWAMGISALLMTGGTQVGQITLRADTVGYEAATSLSHALKVNRSLHVLNLKCRRINETGILTIASSLKANTTLQSLYISNPALQEPSPVHQTILMAFGDALRSNRTLTTLQLLGVVAADPISSRLATATGPHNTSLVEFRTANGLWKDRWISENANYHDNYIDATNLLGEAVLPLLIARTERASMVYNYLRSRIDLVVQGLQLRDR